MTVSVTPQRPHHWSGWPGAYCFDCGMEDQMEICVGECGGRWAECSTCSGEGCKRCCGTGLDPDWRCDIHSNAPCPGAHNPNCPQCVAVRKS